MFTIFSNHFSSCTYTMDTFPKHLTQWDLQTHPSAHQLTVGAKCTTTTKTQLIHTHTHTPPKTHTHPKHNSYFTQNTLILHPKHTHTHTTHTSPKTHRRGQVNHKST